MRLLSRFAILSETAAGHNTVCTCNLDLGMPSKNNYSGHLLRPFFSCDILNHNKLSFCIPQLLYRMVISTQLVYIYQCANEKSIQLSLGTLKRTLRFTKIASSLKILNIQEQSLNFSPDVDSMALYA